jgi:uncharacterized membrane protein
VWVSAKKKVKLNILTQEFSAVVALKWGNNLQRFVCVCVYIA